MADLNAGINEITTPTAFISGPTTVYVKVTTPQGCTGTAQIVLTFLPLPVVNDATLQACSIETTPTFGLFNLTSANVTSETGITKKFYTTLANALAETNEIQNPILYISTSTDVYVRVTSTNNCLYY